MKSLRVWGIIALFCAGGLINFLPAQSSAESAEPVLLFTHQHKNKAKYLKQGKRIAFWLKGSEQKYKGHIVQLRDDSLITSDTIVSLNQLRKVRGRSIGLAAVKTAGGVVLATGTISSILGGIFIYSAYNTDDACGAAILLILGIVLAAVGLILMVLGGIPFLFRGRTFDLLKKWDVRIAHKIPLNKKKRKSSWMKSVND